MSQENPLIRHPKRSDYTTTDTGLPAGVRLQARVISGMHGDRIFKIAALAPDDPILEEDLEALIDELRRMLTGLRRHGPSVLSG